MAFTILPGRNRIIQAAWAMHDAANKKEGKTAKAAEKADVARPKEAVVRSEPYRRLVAAMPCIRCGKEKRSQAAHVPTEGKGIKVDDRETFPLCADGPGYVGCHPQFDQYKLFPRDKTVKQGKKWAAQTREAIEAADLWPKKLAKWKPKK